jgi:ubiquinone/menaquinone biosynthesis C-methylase UbiE
LKDETFDLIVGNGILHHLFKIETFLREVKRVLRPGGVALFLHESNKKGDEISRALITWLFFLPIFVIRIFRRITKKDLANPGHLHPTDLYP